MADLYGSDFFTIVDEDGTEYEIEVLCTIEYNGVTYHAAILAGAEYEEMDALSNEVAILKSVDDEDGEPILCAVEDEEELQVVNDLIMDQLYESEDTDE